VRRVSVRTAAPGAPTTPPTTPDPLPATRPAAIAALAALLAVADDATRPQAEADAAEAQAIALARRLAGLDPRTGRAPGGREEDAASTSSSSAGEGDDPPAPPGPVLLRGFGRARQVPKRAYTLADLRLNKVEPDALLSPTDATLDGVRSKLRNGALAAATLALVAARPTSPTPLIAASTILAGAWVADAVGTGGAVASLALDAAGRALAPVYARRVAAHEAGHFLIAFLVGLLPRGYTLSSAAAWGAAVRERGLAAALAGITRPAAQAGTRLCDAGFRGEVTTGKIRAATVDAAVCVALAGVTAEYLGFGSAEGGLDDVAQLDGLLRALGFSQAKADSQIRWAVLNDAALLRRYAPTHAALAAAMERGAGVGECVAVIEGQLDAMTDAEI
jgi:hypothetical protein